MDWQKEVDDTQEKIDKGLPLQDKLFQLYQQRDPTYGPHPTVRADLRVHEQAKARWNEAEKKGNLSDKEKDKIWMSVYKQYWSDDGVPKMVETDPQYEYASDPRNLMEERLIFLERNRPSVWLRRIPVLKEAILNEVESRRVHRSKLTNLLAEWYTLVLEALFLDRDLLEQSLIHQIMVPVFDMEPSTCREFGMKTAQTLVVSPMIRYGLIDLLMDAIEQKYKNAVSAAKRRVTYFQNKVNEGDSSAQPQLDKAKVQLVAVQDQLADLESKQQRSAAVQLDPEDLEEIARKAWEVTKLYKGAMDKNKVYDEAFARLRKRYQEQRAPPARPISEAIQELDNEIRAIEEQIRPMIKQMAKPEAGRRGLIAASSSNTRPVKLWEETARLYAKLLDLEYIRDEKKKRQADGREEDISIRAPPPNDERKDKWKARREEDLDVEMQLLVMQTNDSRAEAERNLVVDLSHTENSLRRKGLSPYRQEALTRRKEHLEKKQERLASINRDIEDLSMNDNKSQQAEQELEELRSMRDSLMKDLAPSWPSVSEDDVVDKFRQKISEERKSSSQNEEEPDLYSEEIEDFCEQYERTSDVACLMAAIEKQKEMVAKTGESHSLQDIIEGVVFYLPSSLQQQARIDIEAEYASYRVNEEEESRFANIVAQNRQALQRLQEARQKHKKPEPEVIDLVSDEESEKEEKEEESEEDIVSEESEDEELKKEESEEEAASEELKKEESEEETVTEESEEESESSSDDEPRRSARIQAGAIDWSTDRKNTVDAQEVTRRERQRAHELASEVDNADQLRADLADDESDEQEEEGDEQEEESDEQEEESDEQEEESDGKGNEQDEESDGQEEEEKAEIPTREIAKNEPIETIPVRTPGAFPRAIITNSVQCPRNSLSKAYLGGFEGRQASLTRPTYKPNTWESWVTGDDIELVDREMPMFTLSQLMTAINLCLVSKTSSVRMLEYLFCRARLCDPTMRVPGKRLGIAGESNLVNKLVQASLSIKTLTNRDQYDELETKYAPQRAVHTPACFTRFVTYDSEYAPEFSMEEEIHLNMISKITFIISGAYNGAIMSHVINKVLEKYSEADRKRFKALLP